MRSVLSWSDRIPEHNGETYVVQDLTFSPDGSQLVVAVGTRVLVYDAVDGTLLHSLKGHKGIVYTVSYQHDGKRFASGGADNIVIIWTDKAEGILKYTHNDSIQKLVYNPATQCLASCTATDFGLWAPEQKSVAKHKVTSKILTASWTNDGQLIALGLLDGQVTIRDRQGNEKQLLERGGPVWALSWSLSANENADVLTIGSWDKTLSMYGSNGAMVGKPRKLAFNPTCIQHYSKGKYLLVTGSNRKAALYSRDGIQLSVICELDNWIWTIAARPKTNFVAVGCEDSSISVYCLVFGTVHGIYQERYTYRENLTDVIVQHLMTEQKVRIKTRDYVKKLSVYRDRLAVQVSDRILIYELTGDQSYDMRYRTKERIQKKLPCNLLVVTSCHFILCQKQKLQQYDFTGKMEREWILNALIRYIKVTGGARGQEGLLVGLKDGSVWQIFINNPFPVLLLQLSSPILCLDISANREKLAVVDDTQKCSVYNVATKALLYEEQGANSVAWNTEFEDMLCFAGNGFLKVKTGLFPVHSQRMQGFVVGFTGSKVFCLHSQTVQTIDVPQSAPLYRYIDQKDFGQAYRVSCLGVTQADWKLLAWEALKHLDFDTAHRAFARVRDVRSIEIASSLQQSHKQLLIASKDSGEQNKLSRRMTQAEVLAFQGRFQLAAKLFADCNEPQKAIQMFADLRMWEEAKKFAAQTQKIDIQQLVKDQAKRAEEVQDWRAAAEMHIASGNTLRAVEIMGERGWFDDLADLVSKTDSSERALLSLCGKYFTEADKFVQARDVFLKVGDFEALVRMHLRLEEWEAAVRVAQSHRNEVTNVEEVYLPYAEWLAGQDRFEEALEAYASARRPDHCAELLKKMIQSAVIEHRFQDASYYHLQRCNQLLSTCTKTEDSDNKDDAETQRFQLEEAFESERMSELYYAYALIYSYTDEPFTTLLPEPLFHTARFLVNQIAQMSYKSPPGISLASVYFTLGHHAIQLESFKLARQAFDKLLQMKIKPEWSKQVELMAITLQSKPYSDKEELLPVDYRSSAVNPLLNPNATGDVSVTSGHPFIRSFISFENLPLVEFQPAEGISDVEAEKMLAVHPNTNSSSEGYGGKGWRESDEGGTQTLRLGDDDDDGKESDDRQESRPKSGRELFDIALNKQAHYGASTGHRSFVPEYKVLQLDALTLEALHPTEVFVVKYPGSAIRNKYYKNVIPEIRIHYSRHCRRFFHEEDFEMAYLRLGQCPCCHDKEMEYDEDKEA